MTRNRWPKGIAQPNKNGCRTENGTVPKRDRWLYGLHLAVLRRAKSRYPLPLAWDRAKG